jgi:hypothetical protein
MIVFKKALPRRTFLRGMGAALALPLLDAMAPALTATSRTAFAPVSRLGFVYVPMGMTPAAWTPPGEGLITDMSPSLSSLGPFLDQITIITNLQNKNSYPDGGGGGHATANCTFLSAAKVKRTEGTDYEAGTTIDQIAARQIGNDTPLPSLELSTDFLSVVGACDNGFACAYMGSVSWASPTTPLPHEPHPRVVFERLFGDGGTAQERRAQLRKNASLLDWVMEDMTRLRMDLPPQDRTKLNEYLDAVREVERRIEKSEQRATDSAPDADRPMGVPASWDDHVRLMFDLQVLALQADITRVITFQMARELSQRTYPEIGVPDPHHALSHHQNNPESLAKLAKINAHHVTLFSYFLEKLRQTPDGAGSLLDHSLYLLGSGMGNPDVHDHENLPVIVAGGGARSSRAALHIRYPKPTPLANLLLTVLERGGVHLESFSNSTGKVEELLA